MRCWPGAVAIVVSGPLRCFHGVIVTCQTLYGGEAWTFADGPVRCPKGCPLRMTASHDEHLRPLLPPGPEEDVFKAEPLDSDSYYLPVMEPTT